MANLTITGTSVVAGVGALTEDRIALAALTAGQAAYADDTTGQVGLADANSATAQVRVFRGIVLNPAAIGQTVKLLRSGPVTIGATLSPGQAYYLSATAGSICLFSDLTTGDYPTLIGVAMSASVLFVAPVAVGVAL